MSARGQEDVKIKVIRVVVETDLAVGILMDHDDEMIWIPKSQIGADFDHRLGTMWVKRWFAETKDLPHE